MKQRHSVEQIIAKLRRADAELGKHQKVPEVCKLLEITEQTYYRWWQKYGGMAPTMAKELKALQQENCAVEEVGGEPGLGHGDSAGGRPGKLVSPERRRQTVDEVRRRLGPDRVSERRVCRVLGHSPSRATNTYRIIQFSAGRRKQITRLARVILRISPRKRVIDDKDKPE